MPIKLSRSNKLSLFVSQKINFARVNDSRSLIGILKEYLKVGPGLDFLFTLPPSFLKSKTTKLFYQIY